MRGKAVPGRCPGGSVLDPCRIRKSLETMELGRSPHPYPKRLPQPAPALPKQPPMAVQTIAFARSALAAEPDHDDTPADLSSGRSSFEDALGRETALRRGGEREEPPADEREKPADDSSDPDELEL